jgi:hypothetical protein
MSVDTGSVVGGVGIAMSIISMVYAAVNHKRIRAKCCGRIIEMELDVTDTPHPKPAAEAVGADKRRSAKVRPAPPAEGEEVVDLEKGGAGT